MYDHDEFLPLFPLNTVLFPYMYLPMHIFEERYKLMINNCLLGNRGFGVLLVDDGEDGRGMRPYDIGTVGRITDINRLSDGRFNLILQGVRRFRVLEYDTTRPYLSGKVELLDDEEQMTAPGLVSAVSRMFGDYLNTLLNITGQDSRDIALPNDAAILSYLVADGLQIEWTAKQGLLEMASAQQRLDVEATILQKEVVLLKRLKTIPKRLVDHERDSFSLN
jgi:uncharacterized protein